MGVADFFVYMPFLGSPGHIWMCNMSMERHSQREHSTVGIVENSSVGTELFKKQV